MNGTMLVLTSSDMPAYSIGYRALFVSRCRRPAAHAYLRREVAHSAAAVSVSLQHLNPCFQYVYWILDIGQRLHARSTSAPLVSPPKGRICVGRELLQVEEGQPPVRNGTSGNGVSSTDAMDVDSDSSRGRQRSTQDGACDGQPAAFLLCACTRMTSLQRTRCVHVIASRVSTTWAALWLQQ